MTEKRYTNVVDMVWDITKDDGFANELKQEINETSLVRSLVLDRIRVNMSQQDVADKLGWSLIRVHEFECSKDRVVRLGDVLDYARAVGSKITFTA